MIYTGVCDVTTKDIDSVDYKALCVPGSIIMMHYYDEDEPFDDGPFVWDSKRVENFPNSKAALLVNIADTAKRAGYGLRFADEPMFKLYPVSYFLSFKFTMMISGNLGHDSNIEQIIGDLRKSLDKSYTISRRDGLYTFRSDKCRGSVGYTTTSYPASSSGTVTVRIGHEGVDAGDAAGLGVRWIEAQPDVWAQRYDAPAINVRYHNEPARDFQRIRADQVFARRVRENLVNQNLQEAETIFNFDLD